ncbi:hypothetical protein CBR_g24056 [Chara braunii]|uniref:CCHC-type domain-containing protein n=1 Tax=Chara braunii TaxID=69332 RepID=A0A388L5M8_CHABU|nr:hypothetical protein CBR_g24056 [Chara braunii]|eukprot:GBG77610.1 hypothetical protein CBR_g24056 [Chara braunii]
MRVAPIQHGLAPAPPPTEIPCILNVYYTCHQPGHIAQDCPLRPPQQRVGAAPVAAALIANGPGRVGALMEEMDGGGSTLATMEKVAELISLDQYVTLGYPGLGMIGTIRPAPEQREVAEWRHSPGEMESGGPTFVTGEIDVLNIVRALDHRIPLPVGHLLSISEQANERMLQHCKWVRCSMGICNMPATFQRAMNVTFQNFVNKTWLTQGMINFCVIVYMDDILVYSETYHGHAQHIEWTLGALRDVGFKIALEKSEFFLSEISFLGYVVTRGGLRPDSRKVAAVKDAHVPMSVTQVRAFLGLASYYRRFIKGFAAIARPLTNLLRKDQPLSWDAECEQAFATVKGALATTPILIGSDPRKQFILITDWQPEAISAILAQKGSDGREHVIEYASRTVPDERRNDSAPQGECYVVVWGIQHFHPYLYGQKFLLVTDHESLLALKKLTNYTGEEMCSPREDIATILRAISRDRARPERGEHSAPRARGLREPIGSADRTPHVLSTSPPFLPISSSAFFLLRFKGRRRFSIAFISSYISRPLLYPLTIAMSFPTERAFGDHLLAPHGYISAIRQVHHSRFSLDLLRLAQFFCTTGVYEAAEFRFAINRQAVVLAEAVAVHRLSTPGVSHVSTVVSFSGDISAISPLRHTAIRTQWELWREHFIDLSVCLVGVRLTWTRDEEHRAWIEYLELLIIQAWRTEVEGDLLGFLFGSVRLGHRQIILQELTIPLTQLVDDLPLDIVSQCDKSPIPHILTRTLTPYLQWSAYLEESGSNNNLPSQRGYLNSREIIDLAFFQPRTASEDEELTIEEGEEEEDDADEDEEEETPEEGSYNEHSEGEQSDEEEDEEQEEEEEDQEQEVSEWESLEEEAEHTDAQAEDPEAVRKREEIEAGKRQLEFASGADLPIADDPAKDPEPPKPENGDPTAETSSAPARRRRSQSPSPSTSDSPPVRARTDAGHRASSPVLIPSSP